MCSRTRSSLKSLSPGIAQKPLPPSLEAHSWPRGIGWYIVFGLCVLVLFHISQGYFTNSLSIQNDERQQIMPYLSFHHSDILRGSLLRDYVYSYTTVGHKLLYWLLTFFIPPLIVSKLVTIGLFIAMFYYCCRLGGISVPAAGVAMAILMVKSPVASIMMGGLPRSFAPPLALAFLYYAVARSERGVLAAFLLQTAFYPSAALVCAIAYGLLLAVRLIRGEHMIGPEVLRFGATLLAGFLLVLPNLSKPDSLGSIVTLERASKMAEFGPHGRFADVLPFPPVLNEISRTIQIIFEPVDPVFRRAWVVLGGRGFAVLCFAVLGLSVGLLVRERRKVELTVLASMATASVVAYLAARALAFKLFLPSRMLECAWPFVIALTCCMGLACVPAVRVRGRVIQLRGLALAAFLLLTLVISNSGVQPPTLGIIAASPQRGLYEFFKKCPADARVAGDPVELDNVMTLSAREAYVTYESAHPLYDRYYAEVRRRFDALHSAYFTTEMKGLADFFRKEKIDYLLIHKADFRAGGVARYRIYEPLDSDVHRRYGSVPPERFVLSQLDLPGVVYNSFFFRVIDARKFLESSGFPSPPR